MYINNSTFEHNYSPFIYYLFTTSIYASSLEIAIESISQNDLKNKTYYYLPALSEWFYIQK